VTTSVRGCCARLSNGIEVISEASRHLDSDLKAQYDLRWDDIAGIGNILRHEYQRVAVKNDLPGLKAALLALKDSLK
jgi:uncharacterized protein with HEPN domain